MTIVYVLKYKYIEGKQLLFLGVRGETISALRVRVRTRSSLRDLNHLFHFSQRCRAGLCWFAPAGAGFSGISFHRPPGNKFSRTHSKGRRPGFENYGWSNQGVISNTTPQPPLL
jgi:hypothetical protein